MPVDYSKFDKIVDSDDETEKKKNGCENCGKAEVKLLRCRCKKVAYCSLDCQRKDYKYHKRVCTPAKVQKTPEASSSSSSSEKKPKPQQKPPPPRVSKDDSSEDEDDDEPITWYKHRETKLPPSESSGPSKLAEKPKAEQKSQLGSAWNAAGTWEERDVTKWVSENLDLNNCSTEFVTFVDAKAEGDASVGVIRGKAKRIMDVNVTVSFEALKYKGKLHVRDFTHEAEKEPVQVHLEFTDAPKLTPETAKNLKLALLGHPDKTTVLVEPNAVGAAFAQKCVQHLRRHLLPNFLRLE